MSDQKDTDQKKQKKNKEAFSVDQILSEVSAWEGVEDPRPPDSPFMGLVAPSGKPSPPREQPAPEEPEAEAAAPPPSPPAPRKKQVPIQESAVPAVPPPAAHEPPEQAGLQEYGHLTLLPPVRRAEQPAPEEAQPPEEPIPPQQEEGEAQEQAEEAEAPQEGEEKPTPEIGPPDRRGHEKSANQEDDERDNLVPFLTPKEPETIRELVSFLLQKLKIWQRLRRDKVAKPMIRLDQLSISLPHLPDLPEPEDAEAKNLARQYGQRLGSQRLEAVLSLVLSIMLLLLAVANQWTSFSFLEPLRQGDMLGRVSLGGFLLVAMLCKDVLAAGALGIVRLRMGMETPALFATICVVADAISVFIFQFRDYSLPMFAPVALVLSFQMLGTFWRRDALRITCRTADRAKDPDLLVRESQQYDGQAVYRRRTAEAQGFGTQIQQEDVTQKTFRYLVPLLCVATLGLCLWATLGQKRQDLVFWSLSAGFAATSTLSGCQCFSLPFHSLAIRLSKLGAALAGWTGIQNARRSGYALLEDADLFPPGAVELTSFRPFHEFGTEIVISVTASLLREAGSGLDLVFENLIRMDEGSYVAITDFELHNDGISGTALGEPVLVGTADFLERMGIALPSGVRVPTGAMTAISGRFAGQFVLDYSMHKTPTHTMDALLLSRITPILTAVDFNLVPAVLRRQFRFPWDSMVFPDMTRRNSLRNAPAPTESTLIAVLSVEGLPPLSTAIVGARRLHGAVRNCLRFTCIGSLVGLLLVFYLSMSAAVTALSPMSLSVFLILWFVPVGLISGWVNQF